MPVTPKPIAVDAISIPAHKSYILDVVFSCDGKMLLTVGHLRNPDDDALNLWDVASGMQLPGIRPAATYLGQFIPSNAAFVSFHQKLNGWEILRSDIKSREQRVLHTSKLVEWPVALWADRSTAVVATRAGDRDFLRFVDYGKREETLVEFSDPFKVLGFSPDKKLVAMRYKDGTVKVFDWAKKKKVSEFITANNQMEKEEIAHWFVTSDSKFAYVAVRGFSTRLEKWDLEQGKLVSKIKDPPFMMFHNHAVVTPDDAQIVMATTFINLKTGKVTFYSLKGARRSPVTALAISRDGRTCAVGEENGMVHIFATPNVE